jgi:hypothetical protein
MKLAILESGEIYTDWFADGLAPLGVVVVHRDRSEELQAGDLILVAGSARYVGSHEVEILSSAGGRGVRRILWQAEPLPPADFDGLAAPLMRGYLGMRGALVRNNDSIFSRLSRIPDWATAQAVAANMRLKRSAYPSYLPSPKMLRFPLREARALKELWDHRLIDRVFVSLPSRQPFLAQLNIPSEVVPAAYGPWFGRRLEQGERDIDVVFLGRITPRRRDLIEKISVGLERRGWALQVVDRDCYGEDRTRLLNRSRIALVLHKHPWEFPLMRLFMAMSCGALVVAEKAATPPAYFDDRHLVVTDTDRLVETLSTYLADDELRARMAEAAYERATSELTWAKLMGPAVLEARHTELRRAS